MTTVQAWLVISAAFLAAAGTWFRAWVAWKERKEKVSEFNCRIKADHVQEDAYIRALNRVGRIAKIEKDSTIRAVRELALAILEAIDEELFD